MFDEVIQDTCVDRVRDLLLCKESIGRLLNQQACDFSDFLFAKWAKYALLFDSPPKFGRKGLTRAIGETVFVAFIPLLETFRSLAEAETQLKTGVAVTGEIVSDDSTPPEVETMSAEAAPEIEDKASPAEADDAENDQTTN